MRSSEQTRRKLIELEDEGRSPAIVGYHRIDGPGSSLSLPLFQRVFSTITESHGIDNDPTWSWSKGLPRTVSWTISTGTQVSAHPFKIGKLAMESADYPELNHVEENVGEIIPVRKNWILRIMECYGLNGVMFRFRNIDSRTRSCGLGGSATATTAASLLANHLTGEVLTTYQVVALASFCENDYEVSLTGTQEQWNVVAGGVRDYVWVPFGLSKCEKGYGNALTRELLSSDRFGELERRSILVSTGKGRVSAETNRVWLSKLRTLDGFMLCKKLVGIAYKYAEAIRNNRWTEVTETMEEYRRIRTELCPEYMANSEWAIDTTRNRNATAFPLGAGGGTILIWVTDPKTMPEIKTRLIECQDYSIIPFGIRRTGYELVNPVLND